MEGDHIFILGVVWCIVIATLCICWIAITIPKSLLFYQSYPWEMKAVAIQTLFMDTKSYKLYFQFLTA